MISQFFIRSIVILGVLGSCPFISQAQVTRFWIGNGTVPLNWNADANWSASSGGTGGASFPVAGDNAIFDTGGNADCSFNLNVDVATLAVDGYTGNILQNASLTVSGKLTLKSATLLGNTQPITLSSLEQSGASVFKSTSGILTIRGNADFTGGGFQHNSGTIWLYTNNGSSITVTGSPVLNTVVLKSNTYALTHTISNALSINNLYIDVSTASAVDLTVGTSVTVNQLLSFDGATGNYGLHGGVIKVLGNITLNAPVANAIYLNGNASIEIAGTGTQNITSTVAAERCMLPSVKINKPSGLLNLGGIITVAGPRWDYVTGTIAAGTSAIYFYQVPGLAKLKLSGTHSLGEVTMKTYYDTLTVVNALTTGKLTLIADASMVLDVQNTLTVNGVFTFSGADDIVLNTGTIYVNGDMKLLATYNTVTDGSATIALTGTANQTITGSTVLGRCSVPKVIIDKPASSALTLQNIITMEGNFTYTSGLVNASGSTVYFNNAISTAVTPIVIDAQGTSSTMAFNNVQMNNPSFTYTLGGALDVDGNLDITGTTKLNTSGSNFPVNVAGNFTNATAGGAFIANASVLTIDGTGNKTLTLRGTATTVSNLTIDKTGGSIQLLSPVTIQANGSLVLSNGTILTVTPSALNILTLSNGVTTSIGNSSSYVNGPLNYVVNLNGTRTINLPLGKGSSWAPAELTVTHNNVGNYTYTAEMINASAHALTGYTAGSTIDYVSGKRYWSISRNVATNFTSASVKFYFSAEDEVSNLGKLGLAKTINTGTVWTDVTSAGKTGTGIPYLSGSIVSSLLSPALSVSGLFSLTNLLAPTGTNNPLPVELTDFKVVVKNGNAVLAWETKSEKNNEYFSIQRSTDGYEFQTLDRVMGAGTTTEINYYIWEDRNTTPGTCYYRLRQTDYDGKFEYSNVIRYQRNPLDPYTLQIYPVPVTDGYIYFNHTATVKIISETGIALSYYENVDKVDVTQLATGMYVIIDQYGIAHKMIIRK